MGVQVGDLHQNRVHREQSAAQSRATIRVGAALPDDESMSFTEGGLEGLSWGLVPLGCPPTELLSLESSGWAAETDTRRDETTLHKSFIH